MSDSDPVDEDARSLVQRLLAAATRFDIRECDRLFAAAVARFGPVELIMDVFAPVLREAGNRWHKGEFSVVQEHLITGVVRRQLSHALDRYAESATGPMILFTTLSGERHEIGVLMAAVIAASRGLRCIYLGPDLRASDICEFCAHQPIAVLALSTVSQPDVTDVAGQLAELRSGLPANVEIWVGGRAATVLTRQSLPPGVVLMTELPDFLDRLSILAARPEN